MMKQMRCFIVSKWSSRNTISSSPQTTGSINSERPIQILHIILLWLSGSTLFGTFRNILSNISLGGLVQQRFVPLSLLPLTLFSNHSHFQPSSFTFTRPSATDPMAIVRTKKYSFFPEDYFSTGIQLLHSLPASPPSPLLPSTDPDIFSELKVKMLNEVYAQNRDAIQQTNNWMDSWLHPGLHSFKSLFPCFPTLEEPAELSPVLVPSVAEQLTYKFNYEPGVDIAVLPPSHADVLFWIGKILKTNVNKFKIRWYRPAYPGEYFSFQLHIIWQKKSPLINHSVQ